MTESYNAPRENSLPRSYSLFLKGDEAYIVNRLFNSFTESKIFNERLDSISLRKLLNYLKSVSLEDPSDVWTDYEIGAARNLRNNILLDVGIDE